jgi:hypothetical protein
MVSLTYNTMLYYPLYAIHQDGKSLIYYAAKGDHPEMIEHLSKNGVSIDTPDKVRDVIYFSHVIE